MKKFLLQFFYFSLVPVFLILVIEIFITCYHDLLFSEQRLEKLYKNDIVDYEWIPLLNNDSIHLLAGSSSVKYGLSCSQLNELNPDRSCYVNMAYDARDPIATYFILKNLDSKKISSVYMGLDPWIYAKQYYKHRNSYYYLDLNIFQTILFTFQHDKTAFLQRYKVLLSVLLNEKPIVSSIKRVVPPDFGSVALTQIPKNFDVNPIEMFQIKTYGWSDLQFTYLKKIIDYCQAKQIPFSMFIPPKRTDFISSYKADCAKIHHDYLQLMKKYGVQAPIFGTFDQSGMDGDSTYFVEGFHLNQQGQKRYTELFYRLIQERKAVFSVEYQWYKK